MYAINPKELGKELLVGVTGAIVGVTLIFWLVDAVFGTTYSVLTVLFR